MLNDSSKYPRLRTSRLNKLISFSVTKKFQDNGYDVTNEQELILRNLRSYGKMSITKLSSYTGQDRHNLSRTIVLLEKKGYVKKIISNVDKRYCEISITQNGENVHEKLWQILEEWRMIAFRNISVDDLNHFCAISEAIMNNIKEPNKTE